MIGTVLWFNDVKGWGFITQADGRDAFVHYRDVHMSGRRTLKEGQVVECDVEEEARGLRARNVTLIP